MGYVHYNRYYGNPKTALNRPAPSPCRRLDKPAPLRDHIAFVMFTCALLALWTVFILTVLYQANLITFTI